MKLQHSSPVLSSPPLRPKNTGFTGPTTRGHSPNVSFESRQSHQTLDQESAYEAQFLQRFFSDLILDTFSEQLTCSFYSIVAQTQRLDQKEYDNNFQMFISDLNHKRSRPTEQVFYAEQKLYINQFQRHLQHILNEDTYAENRDSTQVSEVSHLIQSNSSNEKIIFQVYTNRYLKQQGQEFIEPGELVFIDSKLKASYEELRDYLQHIEKKLEQSIVERESSQKTLHSHKYHFKKSLATVFQKYYDCDSITILLFINADVNFDYHKYYDQNEIVVNDQLFHLKLKIFYISKQKVYEKFCGLYCLSNPTLNDKISTFYELKRCGKNRINIQKEIQRINQIPTRRKLYKRIATAVGIGTIIGLGIFITSRYRAKSNFTPITEVVQQILPKPYCVLKFKDKRQFQNPYHHLLSISYSHWGQPSYSIFDNALLESNNQINIKWFNNLQSKSKCLTSIKQKIHDLLYYLDMGMECTKQVPSVGLPQEQYAQNIGKLARRSIDEFYDPALTLNGAPLKGFIQTKEPYEALCYLKVVFDKKEYGCCGCLIGPKHLITAARNVYDPVHRDWATSITIFCNMNPQESTPQTQLVESAVVRREWMVDNKNLDKWQEDLAVITLQSNVGVSLYPQLVKLGKEKILKLRGYHYIWGLEKQRTYRPMAHLDVLDTTVTYNHRKSKIQHQAERTIHPVSGSPLFDPNDDLVAIYHHAIYDSDERTNMAQQNLSLVDIPWVNSIVEFEEGKHGSKRIKFEDCVNYYMTVDAPDPQQRIHIRHVTIGEDEFEDEVVPSPKRGKVNERPRSIRKNHQNKIVRQNSIIKQKKQSIASDDMINRQLEIYGPYSGDTILGLEFVRQDDDATGVKYHGYLKNDLKHGNGRFLDVDGSLYEGEFYNGLRQGQGRRFFSNGDVYIGEFYEDNIQGHGTYIYMDGRKYEGQLDMGLPNGVGKMNWKSGSMYDGNYLKGQRHGQGLLVMSDGCLYHGEFYQDKIEGTGVFKWPDGKEYNGRFVNNQMDGYGVYKDSNIYKYTGLFRQDLKHGQGLIEFEDGRAYKGSWHYDKLNGYVVYTDRYGKDWEQTWENGRRVAQVEAEYHESPIRGESKLLRQFQLQNRRVQEKFMEHGEFNLEDLEDQDIVLMPNGDVYVGQWNQSGDKRQGYGKCQFQDGSLYEGYWKNDLPQGLGRWIFISGDYYIGKWKKGIANGQGKLVFANGDIYIGEFVTDFRTGYGHMTYANGSSYKGQFWKGQRQGFGILIMPNGSRYEGNFEQDMFSGKGIYKWRDGRQMEGLFEKGRMNGYGVFTYPDGRRYKGNFKDDEMDGYGEFQYSDGAIYFGNWINGKQHGHGQMVMEDGRVIKGQWSNGMRKESLTSGIS